MYLAIEQLKNMSHLLQMRGLKPLLKKPRSYQMESHLLQMRGLKQDTTLEKEEKKKSHLLQMRGLKQKYKNER